jgi:hypothetical protein
MAGTTKLEPARETPEVGGLNTTNQLKINNGA